MKNKNREYNVFSKIVDFVYGSLGMVNFQF
jgi:hypothetical protein